MAIIRAFEYEFKVKNSGVFDKIKYNIGLKPLLRKTTKNKTSDVLFDEAILNVSYKKDNVIAMRLSAGTPNSVRADSVILQLAELSSKEITNFEIVKLGQYIEADGGKLVMI
jgi:hypothetical protein